MKSFLQHIILFRHYQFLLYQFVLLLWTSIIAADPLRGNGDSTPPVSSGAAWIPSVLSPVLAWVVTMQRQLVGGLQYQIHLVRDGESVTAALMIIAIGLVYGFVHAVGPGHGKIVIVSYLATRRASLGIALKMSVVISFMQATSAITIVSFLYLILHHGMHTVMSNAAYFETVSFGLITLFGIFIVWRAIRGASYYQDDAGGEHDHSQADDIKPMLIREYLIGAMAVGIRPCTGALLILLFTFANGLFWLGIASVFALAVGSAVTVALTGLSAIGGRSVLERMVGVSVAPWLERIVAAVGGTVIVLVGLAMMATSWNLNAIA